MQPQTSAPPNPDFDFIMKNGQGPKKGLNLPLPNLPKPLLLAAGATILVLVIIVVVSVISGSKKPNNQPYFDALARGQEIARVSTEVEGLSQNSITQNLASTANNSLSGDQQQITSYLGSADKKAIAAALASDMNSDSDNQMKNAVTNGSLDSVYTAYLKAQLAKYQSDLAAAYSIAGPNGKAILAAADNSAKVILSTLQVASAN